MNFLNLCEELESKIQEVYEKGITPEDAEKLAAKFLYAQMVISRELRKADLDTKMRKTGVKALRAAVYLDTVKSQEKKPTEATISATIDTHGVVQQEQDSFDKAEVLKAELERYYDIFTNGHIYARGVAKGTFGG